LTSEFLVHIERVRRYSPHTVRSYAADLAQFRVWAAANGLPDTATDLQPEHFHRYASHLANLYAPSTVRRKLDCLSSFCNYLCALGAIPANRVATVPRPKRAQTIPSIPTIDESRHLLAACRSPRERAVLLLLMTCGLRKAELMALTVEDVAEDFASVTVTGKARKQRRVPLPPQTRRAICDYLADRHIRAGPLILNRVGKAIGSTSLQRLFRRIVRQAGLDGRGWTIHTMRHCFATQMLRAGCDLPTLMELLGHGSLEASLTYLRADPGLKADAVARWATQLMGDPQAGAPAVVPDARGGGGINDSLR
jgi:site-specific recombinase XerD